MCASSARCSSKPPARIDARRLTLDTADLPCDIGTMLDSTVALRHHHDARLLHAETRHENADQLYGFAAECALKEALSGFGMPHDQGQPTEHRHREHIETLWDIATAFLSGRVGAQLHSMLGTDRPFADWHVDQRYETTAVTPAMLTRHAAGAGRALRVMDQARLLGCTR
jgi:hypothetical protein